MRCLPWPQRLVWSLWHAPRDLRRRPVDVFHGVTGFELPGRGPWALVTTVHDLVPLRLPSLVPARHRWAVRCLLGGALRRAHRVIAVSETTRGELLARYRLPPTRVVVVPEAAAPHFVPPGPPALAARAPPTASPVRTCDLVPFRLPALVPARHRWAVRCLLGGALRRAHRVIAVSETTRGEILARFRLPPARVVVVPEAAAPHFVPLPPPALAAARARYRLARPYVLFVGFLEPKKNLDVLLEAVARLRRARAWGETELVVVGAPGWGPDPARRAHALGLDGAVRFVGAAPDADLPALYGGALAFAFPSLWEGFGLPVLEAMAAGAPVVASNRGALPEVTAGAALLVEPAPEPLADALAAAPRRPGAARAAARGRPRPRGRVLVGAHGARDPGGLPGGGGMIPRAAPGRRPADRMRPLRSRGARAAP